MSFLDPMATASLCLKVTTLVELTTETTFRIEMERKADKTDTRYAREGHHNGVEGNLVAEKSRVC